MNGLEVQLQTITNPNYKLDPGKVLPQSGQSLQRNHYIALILWATIKRVFLLPIFLCLFSCGLSSFQAYAQTDKAVVTTTQESDDAPIYESELGSESIFTRAWQGGLIVFMVLLILVIFSILSWAILISKYLYLKKITDTSDRFVKSFWESRSLNDLNGRLPEHPYSPVREIFRTGYAELVRGSQLKESSSSLSLAVKAALDNIERSLRKSKFKEKKHLETYLPFLATIASSSPFIGLFGTVWGIMGAFEGIARTGSASLAAVAPGISEALIATAFGLAAAIPAVIGYNLANSKIRGLSFFMDGFSSDFLNIVERYLISDRPKSNSNSGGNSSL